MVFGNLTHPTRRAVVVVVFLKTRRWTSWLVRIGFSFRSSRDCEDPQSMAKIDWTGFSDGEEMFFFFLQAWTGIHPSWHDGGHLLSGLFSPITAHLDRISAKADEIDWSRRLFLDFNSIFIGPCDLTNSTSMCRQTYFQFDWCLAKAWSKSIFVDRERNGARIVRFLLCFFRLPSQHRRSIYSLLFLLWSIRVILFDRRRG